MHKLTPFIGLLVFILLPAVIHAQQPITPGVPQTGVTTEAEPYVFSGQAGQVIRVELQAKTENYRPQFALLRGKDSLGVWYSVGTTLNAEITLPADGEYTIRVLPGNNVRAGFTLILGDNTIEVPVAAQPAADPSCEYTVQEGDNMFRIAQNLDVTLEELVAANPQIENARVIFPGSVLSVPRCNDP